ncbi:thioredoxin family protein [Haloferula sp. A504]|uniref:thioredoxin family protein n=1 Tax=Haloferula sp. A504 TaxID=3373601 RepID=UPI0031C14A42|nr:thioredoxin family protein [Verrucomicrobiaceae bacterium E54]
MKHSVSILSLAAIGLAIHGSLSPATHAAVKGAKPMPLSEGWTSDFEAARKQAAAENKNLLLDFTGSDWCGPCINLKKTILGKDAFKQGVKDTYILVELDYPRDKSLQTEETVQQNRALAQLYSIKSFPTVLLTDAEGRPFAQMTGFGMEPEEYAKEVNEKISALTRRDEALAKARELEGPEKARALFEALESMKLRDEHIASFYGNLIEQIKEADPDDESGATRALGMRKKLSELFAELKPLGRASKMDEALALLDDALASGDFEGEIKQQVGYEKVRVLRAMKKNDAAIQAAEEAVAIAPDGKWVRLLEGIKGQLEKEKSSE